MPVISTHYRQLKPEEVAEVAAHLEHAWMDARIPGLQYEACVRPELKAWAEVKPVAPYDALISCMDQVPYSPLFNLLEVGASCGYNREVLYRRGFKFDYRALDFSPAYQRLANKLWPEMPFDIGDARALPYAAGAFDIVLSGGVLLHVKEYEQVIAETSRVVRQFAIFHRTPVWDKATTYWLKEAYGVPCLEIWFNEVELLNLFGNFGLPVVFSVDIGKPSDGLIHRSYVCKKGLFHHSV